MTDTDILVVGHGMAAARLIGDLRRLGCCGTRIMVIGGEARPAYNRVLLSSWLANEVAPESLPMFDANWYADNEIRYWSSDPVIRIERERRRVVTASGKVVGYQRLVLATGSRPALPAIAGAQLNGVIGFRRWEDVETMHGIAAQCTDVVVLGGGLLGLEAAEGLRKLGATVTVVQRSQRLLNRQLDSTAATLLTGELTRRGLHVVTGDVAVELVGEHGQVTAVRTERGDKLPADLVVVAMGIQANVELALEAGLSVGRGVLVDQQLTTSDPAVFALGECCQRGQHSFGLVAPIWEQSSTLAAVLMGGDAAYHVSPTMTQLKISGIQLFSCGQIDPPAARCLTMADLDAGIYKKLWLDDGAVVGAVMIGDTSGGLALFEHLMAQSKPAQGGFELLLGH